jgi:hypothetical protein
VSDDDDLVMVSTMAPMVVVYGPVVTQAFAEPAVNTGREGDLWYDMSTDTHYTRKGGEWVADK